MAYKVEVLQGKWNLYSTKLDRYVMDDRRIVHEEAVKAYEA